MDILVHTNDIIVKLYSFWLCPSFQLQSVQIHKNKKVGGTLFKAKKTSDLEHTFLRLFSTQKHLFFSKFHPLKITSITEAVTRKLVFILSFISVNVP